MKSILAKATLGACMLAASVGLQATAGEPVKTYDDAGLTLKDLIRQAEQNISKADMLIEARKLAERNAARDAEARKAFEKGSELAASGDLEGARAEWRKSLEITQSPEMKQYIAVETRKAEEKAAAERAVLQQRIEKITADGAALFASDQLDDSLVKFREALSLDASNRVALQYVDIRIPARKEELRQRAAAEGQAKELLDKGTGLFASGDSRGAMAAYREALGLTLDSQLATTVNAALGKAEAKIVRAAGLQAEGSSLFNADTLDASEAKFREALALDPMSPLAMDYLEVKIPARRVELKQLAAAEQKAKEIFENGNRLCLAGNLDAAQTAWRDALAITRDPSLKAAIAAASRQAEERAAEKRAALKARIDGLRAEALSLFDTDRLDAAVAKFREVLALDAADWSSRQYIDTKIPARRVELQRIATVEQKAQASVAEGDRLFAAGNLAGAKTAFSQAARIAEKPESKALATDRVRQVVERERKNAAALQVRIDALQAEGAALFDADRLDESVTKFREVLALEVSHWGARQYIDTRVPVRKAELLARAEAEKKAKGLFDSGVKLYASGDLHGAIAAWKSALGMTEKNGLTAAINAELRKAEAKIAQVESLQTEGVALFHGVNMDASEAKFREALALDPMSVSAMDYLDVKIPAMRAELERKAAQELKANETFEKGKGLLHAGDLDGAQALWREALSMTEKPELKAAIAEQSRLAEEKAAAERAALRARIDAIYVEGVALYTADRLDEALVKFREVVTLDAANWASRQYIDTRIPARMVELQELATAEEKAKETFEGAGKLFASGDIRGAVSAWNRALKITTSTELTASINAELRLAEEKLLKAEALKSEGVALFSAGNMDASEAKFREALVVDPMHPASMDYLEVKVPAMRAELQRKAAQEENAKETFEKGNGLYASGDVAGARSAWAHALSMTENPALQASVTARVRMADEKERQEAAASKAKVAGIYAQGEALFNAGSLNESESKFREVLGLEASHWGARQYIDSRIPGRKAELQDRAEVERRSKEIFEQGNKLYAAGDFEGAKAAWKEAAKITGKYR